MRKSRASSRALARAEKRERSSRVQARANPRTVWRREMPMDIEKNSHFRFGRVGGLHAEAPSPDDRGGLPQNVAVSERQAVRSSLAFACGDVYFVAVDDLKLVGAAAEFTIGAAVATSPIRPVVCCCRVNVRYSRVDGVWIYKGSTGWTCA